MNRKRIVVADDDVCMRLQINTLLKANFEVVETMHHVNSDIAENEKLEQVLSNRGFVCLVGVSRCFLAQPSRPASRNPRAPSSTQCASGLRQTPTLERGRPLALGALARNWPDWRAALRLLIPATVIAWH